MTVQFDITRKTLMLLTLRALRVIFRIIRVLFWETAWHTHSPGNHTWIIPTTLNMFLLSSCLKTVFLKIEEWNRGHPFFFSCIIAQKKPKIQTHCGKWSWRIIKRGFLMNWDVLSQFFFKRERAEAEKLRHGIDIRRNPLPDSTCCAQKERLCIVSVTMTYDKRGKSQYGTQTLQQGSC